MNSDKHEGVLVLHGTARRFDLKAGEEMAVTMPDGCQGGDFSFPGFDQSLTRNILGWEKFGKPWLVFSAGEGSRLFDGDARILPLCGGGHGAIVSNCVARFEHVVVGLEAVPDDHWGV